MGYIFQRIKTIYQHEGLLSILKKVLLLLKSYAYEYNQFYLYEYEIGEEKETETDWIPKVSNYIYRDVFTNKQLSELVNDGFDFSLLNVSQAHHRLGKGAIASLIFVNKELAFKQWLAFTEEAKNTFNNYPYEVDFGSGEVCSGDVWTNPKYRRMGLYSYAGYWRRRLLIGRGKKKEKWIVRVENDIPQKSTSKENKSKTYKSIIYARARYFRLFGLKSWKETLIN